MKTILLALFGMLLVLPAVAQQPPQDGSPAEDTGDQRQRAIERCKENRGVDCESDKSISQWLLKDRSRSDAEEEGSRSIHQTAPVPTPRPAN